MKIKKSAGRLPRNVDVRDRAASLALTASHSNPQAKRFEEELLARIAFEIEDSGIGYFLNTLRQSQVDRNGAPASQGELPN